jgi:hypothetical protein
VKFKRNSFKRSRPVVPLFVVCFFYFFLLAVVRRLLPTSLWFNVVLFYQSGERLKTVDRVIPLTVGGLLIRKILWCTPDPMGHVGEKAEGGGGDVTVAG